AGPSATSSRSFGSPARSFTGCQTPEGSPRSAGETLMMVGLRDRVAPLGIHPSEGTGSLQGELMVKARVAREAALDPQDLARLLVARANSGDVDGMVQLYEPDAVLACGGGRVAVGTDEIRAFYADLIAKGTRFHLGDQRAALICGDLALTSTRL